MRTNIFKKISIYRFQLILVLLTLMLFVIMALYFNSENSSKFGVILGGITASLFVALIQYIFSLKEYKDFSEIKKLDINKILASRDDASFYSNLIGNAKSDIKVMGVTALRMMQDFASDTSPREDKKVLLKVLSQGVSVQLLLPLKDYLDEKNKIKNKQSLELFEGIQKQYKLFEVRYFDHVPTHSIFKVDDKCILGPVFSNFESKDTPCIYMGTNNEYAKKYLAYFENEWEICK